MNIMAVDTIQNSQHAAVDGMEKTNSNEISDVPEHFSTYVMDDFIPPPPLIEDLAVEVDRGVYDKKHKNSEIASSQYGINIFIVGLTLMFAIYLKVNGITESDRLIFLIVLMLIQVLWMIFYIFVGERKKWASTEKDVHAGARWLRCGIVLFASTTLVMHALKLGYFVGYSDCLSIMEGVYPVTHIIHTFFQVYFLWCHSKDVIKSFKTLERFGLIHSVFTNLLLWASAVATESDHQLEEHMERLKSLGFLNLTLKADVPECNCSIDLCKDFKKGIYYIYPFNIEYQILASAMLYVLWKNIGNQLGNVHHNSKFRFHGVAPGTVIGLSVLAVTIGIVVTYLVNIGRSKENSEFALSVYYFYSLAVLGIMCIGTLIGLIIYKIEAKPIMKEKSPSIKLDSDLLVGSAIGSWITSWGSIIAILVSRSHPTYSWYTLPYSILVIVEKYFQNLFIITYINHNLEDDLKVTHIEIPVVTGRALVPVQSTEFKTSNGSSGMGQSSHLEAKKQQNQCSGRNHQTWSFKKSLLKNITVLLFLCNMSLWIPPAFGCRPQYDNGLEATVFGIIPWIVIIDVALPFSIFYRMHSTYSLFDVFCKI
ncbi:proton channel OTOP1-like [Hyperolius riggenbachi]|uniref:proton channel OTOP1-like n=1 Tax=Hyperolius riggenbachi TaxID=752182 RepID=UPI0035A2FBEE